MNESEIERILYPYGRESDATERCERGSGQTARAMYFAPRRAIYAATGISLRYYLDLMKRLGRDDLLVCRTDELWRKVGNNGRIQLVLDHAVAMYGNGLRGVDEGMARAREVWHGNRPIKSPFETPLTLEQQYEKSALAKSLE